MSKDKGKLVQCHNCGHIYPLWCKKCPECDHTQRGDPKPNNGPLIISIEDDF